MLAGVALAGAVLATAALAGCAAPVILAGEPEAAAPARSVERFLRAANSGDLETMASVFGTREGPIADRGSGLGCAFRKLGSWLSLGDRCLTRQEVEIRMSLLAETLRHSDYQIVSEGDAPGRKYPMKRIGVTITRGERKIRDVPFLLVQSSGGLWMVQEIGVERVTSGGG